MLTTATRPRPGGINPLHGLLLSGVFPLFLGAALSDYAYAVSYHVQWGTFASWLIAGALVFNGFALLCAVIGLFRTDRRGTGFLYFGLLVLTGVIGFLNALIHSRDAWAMMPTGLILSIIVAVLALVATLFGFSRRRTGGAL
ncbi:DUF2231 domain-containing protein [Salinisphaera sp. Q1T1-3]|uniref:DUF2231 domain-containing protein n=1 Tax=Salinisphaera sp. Q1T1-3 TaxID=2321229 RepID=UPI000E74DE0A|nr:DUF2231 domain-containing protein [Salinisphaera sp. Q1T1-3]RJS91771.1 hypothetical protein D3260_14335 [Salinisphaera sp. Q1T1-3]